MAAVTICSYFEAQRKILTVSIVSPSISQEVMGPDAIILVFWMLSFKPVFHSPLSKLSRAFQFLFTFCHKCGVICISEVTDISPGNLDSSLCFIQPSISHDVLKWNKQGDNIQPWRTPFSIWNQSVVPCPVLTVASWLAYRFLKSRSGGLVFPSLSEFSTVYCDPHGQRLWHSQ